MQRKLKFTKEQKKTLITDTIDRTLANRANTLSEDVYPATATATDTSGTITSPLRAVESGIKGQNLYRIGSGTFSGFADYAISDNQASAASYTEEQNFWIGSQPNAVAYDSSSSIKDIAVNKFSAMVYNAKFTGNDYGIPICTGELSNADTTDWSSCDAASNARTAKHRVTVKFMGADWVISEMTNPTVSQASSTSVINGGQVKLAKEAKYGIVNVGGVLDAGAFKVRLSDISVATGSNNDHPAIIDVLDANDAVIGQVMVNTDQTYTFTNGGSQVKIHVYKTAPGFTLNAKWAEMAIYTDEITLKDGQRYNLVSSTDADKNFKVSLLWKNRDYNGGVDSTTPDSLREIVVYNVDGFSDKTKVGDAVNFLQSTPTFKVTYQGVDLAAEDYAPLSYSAMSSDSYRVANAPGDVSCGSSSSLDSTYTAKFVEIKTNGATLLGGTGDALTGDYMFEKVLFDPIGIIGGGIDSVNGTQDQGTAAASYKPKVFYKISGRDCYNWDPISYVAQSGVAGIGNMVKFDTAGDNSAAQGALYFSNIPLGGFGNVSMFYQEDAGKYGTLSNNRVYTGVPLLTSDATLSTFRFKSADSSTQNVYYKGLNAPFTGYEPTFVSERGSKSFGVGTSDVVFAVAKKIGMPTFQFAYADAATGAASVDNTILGIGDSKIFGGVTVKVSAIDATSGSCGSTQCVVDSSGVSGVITPNNAATVQAVQPYKLAEQLVYLDTEGASSGIAIVVGGPAVNEMTRVALQGSSVDFDTTPVVVKEIGSKTIVVAGKTAADTLSAANDFVAAIKRQ